MSSPGEEIEFRNREEELQHLLGRVPPGSERSTITFIRAPSGYGKSRLVDQVLTQLNRSALRCVYVEPEIRARHQTGRVYSWYFVQRAAAGASDVDGIAPTLTFSSFLNRKRFNKINWAGLYETGKDAFSLSKLVKLGIEFGENVFGKSRYKPESLLKDESKFATDLARAYLQSFTEVASPVLFIVRETQMIDLESFRFFLNLHNSAPRIFFYFEYTAANEFLPEHQKTIAESRSADADIRIVDLLKLNHKELLFLLRKYVREDIEPDSIELSRWNGNLRLVRELKEQVFVDRPYDSAVRAAPLSSDLRVLIHDKIQSLSSHAKLILAGAVCHMEAVPISVMREVVRMVDSSVDPTAFDRAVLGLTSGARYLKSDDSRLAVGDEDVASVVAESPSFSRFRALAEKSLRDIYLKVLSGDRTLSVPTPLAFRLAIALCLATGDAVSVQRLIQTLSQGARASHDQSMYVNLVADAVGRQVGNSVASAEIQEWAAGSAYEIGDYHIASELIQRMTHRDDFFESLLGFCHGETNRHGEALDIGRRLQSSDRNPAVRILGSLIEIANLFAVGQKAEASAAHQRLRRNADISGNPLFGYVLRFTELFVSFPECTEDVLNSAELFERHGMKSSAAYSRLSGAMHLAYSGDMTVASKAIAGARRYLENEVRDLHILYNNEAVVGLLSDKPDFQACLGKLENAVYGVRDDFYRAVIENNRLICRWQLGALAGAKQSVRLLSQVMETPGFGNRDVFWTFTYNCWAFLTEIGEAEEAANLRRRLSDVKVEQLDYEDYWAYRLGEGERPPARYDHLLNFKYHPEYLSHWLVDLDAICAAKAELH